MGLHSRLSALLLGMLLSAPGGAAALPVQKTVYDLGTADRRSWNATAENIQNEIHSLGRGRVRVLIVIHAAGVRFLVAAHREPALRRKLRWLESQGVILRVSAAALSARHLSTADLPALPATDFVPSGAAEIVSAEKNGYLYINP